MDPMITKRFCGKILQREPKITHHMGNKHYCTVL